MALKIKKHYSECGMDVEKIVRRIMKYAPSECSNGLEEILIMDKDPQDKGFASYRRNDKRIELYIDDIVGWQPWLLKKSFIFPYLSIGLALGHELDHHINRESEDSDREKSAENNALKYIYPSFGIFKPIVKLFSLFSFKKNRF